MYNEILFLIHTIVIFGALIGACLVDKALVCALAAVYGVLANLFVMKKMVLGGVLASGGDLYIIGSIVAVLLVDALWGKEYAARTITVCVLLSGMFFILSWFQCAYVPAATDTMHPFFLQISGKTPRITMSSFVAHYCAQLISLGVCRISLIFLPHFLAGFVGMVCGQVIDVVIFFLGAFGWDSPGIELVHMMGVSIGLKILIACGASSIIVCARWMQEHGYVQ